YPLGGPVSVISALARNLLYLAFGFTLFLLGVGSFLRLSHIYFPATEDPVVAYQKGTDFLRTFVLPVSIDLSKSDLEEAGAVCRGEWQRLLGLDFKAFGN